MAVFQLGSKPWKFSKHALIKDAIIQFNDIFYIPDDDKLENHIAGDA